VNRGRRDLDLRLRRYADNLRREAAPSRDLHSKIMQRVARTPAESRSFSGSAVAEASRPARGRPLPRFIGATAVTAALLLVAGGVVLMRTALSPASVTEGTWSAVSSMAIPRAFQTATLLPSGKVLVVGGSGFSASAIRHQAPLASAELYDPKTRTWSSAGTLRMARWLHTATLLNNGKVLVVGGTSAPVGVPNRYESISSAELYDPQTNTWSPAANMLTPRCLHSATLLADGRVLVAGGYQSLTEFSGRVLATAELYDPTSNRWRSAGSMPVPTEEQSAIRLADGRVLVIGGASGDLNSLQPPVPPPQATVEIYDPATGSWSSAESMHSSRILASTTLLPDGRVLVVGDAGVNAQTAEVFDPGSGHWASLRKPAVGHSWAVSAELPNSGNVLVAGGAGETTAEVFDWHRNTWSSAGDLSVIRSDATATVLKNGQVLIAGGSGNRTAPWASAELYDPAGRQATALAPRTSAPVAIGEAAPLIVIAVVLIVLGLRIARRRQSVRLATGDPWIDPEA
jgi:N-acetylneuraminic acid mutarotase